MYNMPPASPSKILIISNRFDPHVDQMLVLLQQLGIECLRWVIDAFPLQSSITLESSDGAYVGKLRTASWETDLCDIRSVWYRHPAPFVLPETLSEQEARFARAEVQAAIGGLYRVTDWFWVNHPDSVRIAGSKPLQLKVAAEVGFRIPRTLITNEPEDIRRFQSAVGGQIMYKPFNSGFFADTHKICYTTPLAASDFENLDLIRATPGIFQENIPKNIELRVTIIGRKIFATEIHSQDFEEAKDDWRKVDVGQLPHYPHQLPKEIEARCRAFQDRFGLAFGAMDMILTPEDEYVFLECNPSGQFGWIENKTGVPATATLARMLIAGKIT